MRDATVVTGQDSDGNKHAGVAGWSVPGYTELKALGSGGFGDVVLARHDATGTLVAIKYVRRKLLADPQWPQMFRAEAQVLAILDDPNIVRLYEYVESPYGAAIVMELIDGVSVREILAHQGGTTPEAALVVLQGSLLGLAAAHRRGVVHRDYKPENVLVDGNGSSKLSDFGIAARTGEEPVAAGSLLYAPPEQFGGTPASPAGDVYAATATFFECLTGRPPFTGDTAERLLYQHRTEPVPLDPVPEPLRPLVVAGMAKEPGNRPADATTFVTALQAIAARAYGPDWAERGRSHLGEAALLLAALWPSGAPDAVQGSEVERVNLSRNAQESRESRHLRHLWHLEHLRDRRRRGMSPAKAVIAAPAAIVVVAAAALAVALTGSSGGHSHPPKRTNPPPGSSTPGSQGTTLPAVTGSSPASGMTTGGTLVTITGTRLHGPATVKFGAKAGTITADHNTKIIVKSPPGQGTVEITVTTPVGTANAGEFSYYSPTAPMAGPTVTGAVSPATGPTAGGTPVAINGTHLADATMVSFGGVAGVISSDSATQITVSSPPGNGTVDVIVTTPGGTAAAGKFTYKTTTPPPPPMIFRLSPDGGSTAGGTTVTISGTNLSGATSVSFGGTGATIVSDSSTQITATSPPHDAGPVNITVTTPGGTSGAVQFTYQPPPPPPMIFRLSPDGGSTAGGTTVTISGTNLSGATSVSFGGTGATIVSDSSTQITATSPPHDAGSVNITVTTPGGTATTAGIAQFTYIRPCPDHHRDLPAERARRGRDDGHDHRDEPERRHQRQLRRHRRDDRLRLQHADHRHQPGGHRRDHRRHRDDPVRYVLRPQRHRRSAVHLRDATSPVDHLQRPPGLRDRGRLGDPVGHRQLRPSGRVLRRQPPRGDVHPVRQHGDLHRGGLLPHRGQPGRQRHLRARPDPADNQG